MLSEKKIQDFFVLKKFATDHQINRHSEEKSYIVLKQFLSIYNNSIYSNIYHIKFDGFVEILFAVDGLSS